MLSDFDLSAVVIDFTVSGSVRKATRRSNGEIVAIKELRHDVIERKDLETQLQTEIRVHSKLKHPYIIKMYGHFSDAQKTYLVLEYAKWGDMYQLLQRDGALPEQRAAGYVRDIAVALDYCHRIGVIHRDLKPENVLLSDNLEHAKLCDFGWALDKRIGRRCCGTIYYVSPEMAQSQPYTSKIDNWALGVFTYELIAGVPPFNDDDNKVLYRAIIDNEPCFRFGCSASAQNLITGLVAKNPDNRTALFDVIRHPWMNENET